MQKSLKDTSEEHSGNTSKYQPQRVAIYESDTHPDVFFRKDTWDEGIWNEVYENNVYGVSNFKGKTVLDVGAHIGSFSRFAFDGGARKILSFEADPDNFKVLHRNAEADPKIWKPYNKAVWRSDHQAECCFVQKCANPPNTGGGGVTEDFFDGIPVEAIGLDEIITEHGEIDLLKIDAEGSEYQVLLTSSMLNKVAVIVGEYHQVKHWKTDANSVAPSHDMETLAAFLEKQGYIVKSTKADEKLGFFTAFRL